MNVNFDKLNNIVLKLINENKKISTMESCTGGALASAITTIEGSSNIFNFSAVTYSNEYKIKMGVSEDLISCYSVYSMEVAKDMSLKISEFCDSQYGIGITGKLNRSDENNLFGEDNVVFVSIYNKDKQTYTTSSIDVIYSNRELNKVYIVNTVIDLLSVII